MWQYKNPCEIQFVLHGLERFFCLPSLGQKKNAFRQGLYSFWAPSSLNWNWGFSYCQLGLQWVSITKDHPSNPFHMQLHPVSQKIQKQIQGLSSDNQTRLAGKSIIYGWFSHPKIPFLGDFHGFPIATFGFPRGQLQFLHKMIIQMIQIIQDHPSLW
jgi:hypothetical protein